MASYQTSHLGTAPSPKTWQPNHHLIKSPQIAAPSRPCHDVIDFYPSTGVAPCLQPRCTLQIANRARGTLIQSTPWRMDASTEQGVISCHNPGEKPEWGKGQARLCHTGRLVQIGHSRRMRGCIDRPVQALSAQGSALRVWEAKVDWEVYDWKPVFQVFTLPQLQLARWAPDSTGLGFARCTEVCIWQTVLDEQSLGRIKRPNFQCGVSLDDDPRTFGASAELELGESHDAGL